MRDQSNDPFPIQPSEHFFSQALDFMPVPMWIYDLATLAFLEVNNAAIDQYGYSKEEFLSMNLKDIRPDEDIDALLDDVKNTSYRLHKAGIWRHKRKNGEIIIVEIISRLITYGNISARLVLANNVTERKQAEDRNLALNERLEMLIRTIQELSTSPNLDSVMKTVRTSARDLVKADGSTFILLEGDTCYYADEDAILPLWKGDRFPANVCISGWAMKNRKVAVVEDIFTDPRIPVDVYKGTFVKSLAMVPIRINDPLGAIGAYWGRPYTPSDTELQLLHTLADAAARAVENIQLVEGLEKRVAERTLQLESINKELETFTYSVSHDLKAPLRGIDGYSKLLLNLYFKELPEEAQSFLVNIRNSTLKMNQLIDDLLEYSRLDRSQVKKEKIRILDQINAVASIYKEELKADNIRLEVDVKDDMLLADEKGFTISLRNLVGNAIKFSKEKEKPVIGIAMEEDQNNWILKVKDNGIGFDMKYHQRIYEIFQRLHRAEDYPGTGIGLALVQKAMQRMNGRVWAESTLGVGSTFYLELPKKE